MVWTYTQVLFHKYLELEHSAGLISKVIISCSNGVHTTMHIMYVLCNCRELKDHKYSDLRSDQDHLAEK